MIFHEFPEGIITFVLSQRGGFSPRRAALYAFVAAALSTPLGAVVAYPFVHAIDNAALGVLLALSVGALIYVGATHLLPEVEEQNRIHTIVTLAAGVLIGAIIAISGPEGGSRYRSFVNHLARPDSNQVLGCPPRSSLSLKQ
jgi:zinc transporter ZupT